MTFAALAVQDACLFDEAAETLAQVYAILFEEGNSNKLSRFARMPGAPGCFVQIPPASRAKLRG
ncbi:hypothetical protein [Cystobacter ferrugineus]|uniref:Uncharacterized protein n=1 Tax=Cystobacter ferrugineus TaxID=83449 RepID=A0A1L9BAK5_9BACT|nr:hypothetical protein [Cystobacter ferrugineus]OJH39258.1 hypothetical protein BON30_17190 [Cystobacter ferrugineus]